MRKIFLFTLFALLINCSSTQKINGYGEHDNVCQKYDAENDVTYAYYKFNKPIKVKGKWRQIKFNSNDYRDYGISMTNNFNEIMYLKQYNFKKNEHKNDTISIDTWFKTMIVRRISYWKEFEKYNIELLDTNEINYVIFHVKGKDKYYSELIGFSNDSTLYTFQLHKDLLSNNKRKEILLNSFNLN